MAQSEKSRQGTSAVATPTGDGHGSFPGGPTSDRQETKRARRSAPRVVVIPLLIVVLLVGGGLGYRYLQDQERYVSTDNAEVTGALIQVGSLNAGQIASVAVDVGNRVARDQVVATVTLPSSLSMTSGGTPKMGFLGTDDQQASVRSPIDGVVVAREGDPGDTVAAGQPIVTVIDPSQLWVQAQLEETKIDRVRPGQPVQITIDALGRSVPGRVAAVSRATEASFSLLPQTSSSGSFTKVTQLVPVKIDLDAGQASLVLGSSVEVRIQVQK